MSARFADPDPDPIEPFRRPNRPAPTNPASVPPFVEPLTDDGLADFDESTDDLATDASAADPSLRQRPHPLPHQPHPPCGRRLAPKPEAPPRELTAEQRLLLLDTWQRSGLPAGDFAPLVGVSKHTLYAWKKKFETEGPAGLMEKPRGGPPGSRLPELTKRTILMLKQANPDWGVQRISDLLLRGPGLAASPSAVAKVLHEAGYQLEEAPTKPHPDKVRFFERARPNQLWQTDLFTFILKRQNRRVYLVAFMDDHSRSIVSYGLHASQSAALVLEVLRAGLASYGAPEEILNDNGAQYVTWRGKSAFTKELEKRGIRQVVATPRRPQTLGKIERFWGTLWRECVESAIFLDLGDAQRRIGLFIDHYNFARPHSGIDGLVPADRFFGAAPEVAKALKARVTANALELARNGIPKQPFYLTGQVGGQPFSLHAEGEKVFLTDASGGRREVDLKAPPSVVAQATQATPPPSPAPIEDRPPESKAELPAPLCPMGVVSNTQPDGPEPPAPGTSPLDSELQRIAEAFPDREGGDV
jgi:transposase InsO family protein